MIHGVGYGGVQYGGMRYSGVTVLCCEVWLYGDTVVW